MFNNHTTVIKQESTKHVTKVKTASTGKLQRTNPNSRFIRFDSGSIMEEAILPLEGDARIITKEASYSMNFSNPRGPRDYHKEESIKITVLQVLIFGDNQYLCEILEVSKETE